MSAKNKARGNKLEREIVKISEGEGFTAKRAWGSDGRSLGLNPETDVLITYKDIRFTIQAKRRKKMAEYLFPKDADIQVIREDRGIPYAVIQLDKFLKILKDSIDGNAKV